MEEDQDQEELTEFDRESALDQALYNLKVELSAWDSSMLHFLSKQGDLSLSQIQGIQDNVSEMLDLLRPILKNSYYTDESVKVLQDIYSQIEEAIKVAPTKELLGKLLQLKMNLEGYFSKRGIYPSKGKEEEYPKDSYPKQPDYSKMSPKERYPYLLREELERILQPEEIRRLSEERQMIHMEILSKAIQGRLPTFEDLAQKEKASSLKVEEAATERLRELQGRSQEVLSENKGVIESRLWSYQKPSEEFLKFMREQREAKTTEHLSKVRTRPVPKTKLEETAESLIQLERKKL